MTETPDERLGLPSASSMARTRRCPGWLALSRSTPQRVDGSADADEGTARHSLIEIGADGDAIDDSNAAYTVEQAKRNEAEAVRRIGMEGEDPVTTIREQRLWVHDENLQRATSAKLDLAITWQAVALIVDHKTLFSDYGHAKDSEQLLTQVVALCENYGVAKVYVALSQPNLEADKRLTMAEYGWHEIQAARQQLLGWCAEAAKPDAPRNPGEWCLHCPGRHACPEGREMALTPPTTGAPAGITPDAIAATLTDETLAAFCAKAPAAESIIEACRSELKRRIQEGDAEAFRALGWKLEPGNTVKKITKPAVAFGVLAEKGATETEFIGAVTVKKGELEKLYHSKVGGAKAAAAKELEQALKAAGAIEEKQNQPSLTRIK